MTQSCLNSYLAALILLQLAMVISKAQHVRRNNSGLPNTQALNPILTCEAYGRCCQGEVFGCGPGIIEGGAYCYCDGACHSFYDCCPDHDIFCKECDHPYVNIQGKCRHYAGQLTYYYARSKCREQGATIFMPITEEDWINFVHADLYKDVTGDKGDPETEFWLNCRMSGDKWYWQHPSIEFPGLPISWNKFTSAPTNAKTAGLIGVGIESNSSWTWSKQWKPKLTFCQKRF